MSIVVDTKRVFEEEGGTTTSDMGETPNSPSSPSVKDSVKPITTSTNNDPSHHIDPMLLTMTVPTLPPLFADLVSCGELMMAYQQEAYAHKTHLALVRQALTTTKQALTVTTSQSINSKVELEKARAQLASESLRLAKLQNEHQDDLRFLKAFYEEKGEKGEKGKASGEGDKIQSEIVADATAMVVVSEGLSEGISEALGPDLALACEELHGDHAKLIESSRLNKAILTALRDNRFEDAKGLKAALNTIQVAPALVLKRAQTITQHIQYRIDTLANLGEVELADICYQEMDKVKGYVRGCITGVCE